MASKKEFLYCPFCRTLTVHTPAVISAKAYCISCRSVHDRQDPPLSYYLRVTVRNGHGCQ